MQENTYFRPQLTKTTRMHTRTACLYLVLFLLLFPACKSRLQTANSSRPIQFTFLQLNDVYEIAPLEGGSVGGMARVATLRKQLLKENPHTYTFLAGDFLNPSVIGTVKLDGQRIQGAHMVDVMNHADVDYVTFGNHEFDLNETNLQARLDESEFEWISANVFHQTENGLRPFTISRNGHTDSIPAYAILDIRQGEQRLRIGILAVTLTTNQPSYVSISDPFQAAEKTYALLKDEVDAVVALTHLAIEEDQELARRIPGLALIMGGHEHDNMIHRVGNTVIAKADANAKSAYIHQLEYDAATGELKVNSTLKKLDESLPLDPEVDQVVKGWEAKAYAAFRQQGFDLNTPITTLKVPLDGREASIRNQPTNLGVAIARAMKEAWPGAHCGIVNSGSVRLDDQLSGSITEFDLIRALPFGGKVLKVEMKGSLLTRLLEAGLQNKGKGGYLQVYGLEKKGDKWFIDGKEMQADAAYQVAISDFLMSGREENMEFLRTDHPDVLSVIVPGSEDIQRDIRLVLAEYLKKQ